LLAQRCHALETHLLLAIERFTPLEDQAILKGVTHHWPQLFLDSLSDAECRRNSLLLVDHIDHDLTRHLPQMVVVLPQDWLGDGVAVVDIRSGVEMQLLHRAHLDVDWAELFAAEQN